MNVLENARLTTRGRKRPVGLIAGGCSFLQAPRLAACRRMERRTQSGCQGNGPIHMSSITRQVFISSH